MTEETDVVGLQKLSLSSLTKQTSKQLMIGGAITIVLGILTLMGPVLVGVTATVFVAALLVVFGITHTYHVIKIRHHAGFGMSLIVGVLAFFAGAFLWFEPLAGLVTFGAFITIYFFISGIVRVVMALDLKPAKGWNWMLLNGVVTTLLALMLLTQLPLSATWIPGTILGIDLLFFGFALIAISKQVKAVEVLED